MNHDVFISYSRSDYMDENKQVIPGNVISKIKDMFDENGISYWFDEECVYSGDAFARVIAKNIRTSKILLFISTATSNESPWTSDEIAVARAYEKKIIPFRYDNSQYNEAVILYLAKLDFIDYQTNPDNALVRLLAAVKGYLKEEAERRERAEAEENRRKEAEIRRKQREIKERELREKVALLERRRHEIMEEILSCEKTLAGLNREKQFVEKDISDLRNSLDEPQRGKQDPAERVNGAEAKPVVERCYKVGDIYDADGKQGVVFDVDKTGKHGKIVSIEQANVVWSTKEQYDRGVVINATSVVDGEVNTRVIASRADAEEYTAFKWCMTRGEGWYLPAVDELKLLAREDILEVVNQAIKTLKDKDAVEIDPKWYYWSSTERDNLCALLLFMDDGDTDYNFKYFNYYVRAVAKF